MKRGRWGGERNRSGGEGKLLAEGNDRQVGNLMSASCSERNGKHKSVCRHPDVAAAKNNWTRWLWKIRVRTHKHKYIL